MTIVMIVDDFMTIQRNTSSQDLIIYYMNKYISAYLVPILCGYF